MGFYDDGYPERQRHKSKRSSYVWTALISAIIGGLIVLGFAPALMQGGAVPNATPQNPEQATENANQTTVGKNETVNVEVTDNVVDAVEKVRPAVVGVVNLSKNINPWTRDEKTVQQGTGTGVIFEKTNGKARLVTNHHVVAGAEQLEVVTHDGNHISAKLLGSDEITDLAVLEIDAAKAEGVAEFGNSDKLKVGEPAIAIGNPLGMEFSQSVTTGVISAKDRSIQVSRNNTIHVLQTDAAINPGNSGGPLVNIAGQVIGINSLKIAQQGVEGLGFAIPINDAKPIIKDLIERGKVIRPYMGVSPIDLNIVSMRDRQLVLKLPENVEEGVVVYSIQHDGPAYSGGLRQNDVIVALDDKKIEKPADLQSYLFNEKEIGETMSVTFYRDGKKQTIEMTLGETPLELTGEQG